MAGFNFADRYKAAGLSPGPEIIRLRQEPFDTLREAMSSDRAISLVRLFFGLSEPVENSNSWFREAFAEVDPSFTMIDNAREAAVLSSCLLSATFQERNEGHVEAGLAVLTTAANNRQPIFLPTLSEEAQYHLDTLSVEMRTPPKVAVSTIRRPGASEVAEDVDRLAQSPDWNNAIPIFKKVSEDSQALMNALTGQTSTVLMPLARQVALLQEEVNMLWWYVGGWSKALDRPFIDLDLPVAAVIAGVDLAGLVQTVPGPVAARALLHRVIWTGRRKKATTIKVKDTIDAIPNDALQKLKFTNILNRIPDICPLLTALQKAAEIGKGTAWHQAFRKTTSLSEEVAFTPLDLSMQVYREALLVSLIDQVSNG